MSDLYRRSEIKLHGETIGVQFVKAKDGRLQAIKDADLAPVSALVSELYDLVESKPVAFNSFQWAARFRTRVLALGASTKEEQ